MSFYSWARQRCAYKEDFIILENSPNFPPRMVEKRLGSQYECVKLCFGPENLGFPLSRRRLAFFAVNKERWLWCGPSQEDLVAHFAELFEHRIHLTCDDLCFDSEPNQMQAWTRIAEKRLRFWQPGTPREELNMRNLLTVKEAERYDDYCELFQKAKADNPELGGFMVDLHQNPSSRPRAAAIMFAQVRHGLMVSLSKNWLYTPVDMLRAHGWGSDFSEALLAKFSPTKIQDFIGNGMHLPSMTSFWAYCLAHVVKRSDVTGGVPAPLSSADPEERQHRSSCSGTR